MKRAVLFFLSLILIFPGSLRAVEVAPYYSFEFSEGLGFPSQESFFFSGNLTNDLGLILRLNPRHSLLGLYELKYIGPGLEREEGREFSERAMDHIFFIQEQYRFHRELVLKTQIDFMQEFQRTGADEIWGEGLYDFNRYGGEVTLEGLEYFIPAGMNLNAGLQYHFFEFPNYTDLLAEYRRGEATAETAGGKQNYHLASLFVKLLRGEHEISLQLEYQPFTQQKIIQESGAYGDQNQKDLNLLLRGETSLLLTEKLVFQPRATLLNKKSNQNYLYYKSEQESTFIKDYYDYTEIEVSPGITLRATERREFFFNPVVEWRLYHHRPPRNEEGDFLTSKKQSDTILSLTVGTTLLWNEVSRFSLFYTYHMQRSNMKFERYLPYNYSGHLFGTMLSFSY